MSIHQPQRGYTLLELIVSLALFSIVMVVVSGAYLMLINLDRQVRSINQTVSTMSFTIDSMARSIRTGSKYHCGINGNNGTNCQQFTFTDSQSNVTHYCLKPDNTIGVYNDVLPTTCSAANSITDPNIKIDTLTFAVSGVGAGDDAQPTVVFTMHGRMPTGAVGRGVATSTEFTIETSATQRLLEI